MAESILKDIGLYKMRFITAFSNSEDIMELMLGDGYGQEQKDSIVYSQLFPYLYVDDTQTEVKSYLCIEVDEPRLPTRTIKDMQITIWAYCHKDCMRYSKKDYAGTRADILADMVERVLRDSDQFGIGNLHLDSVTRIFPNNKYYGRQLIFSTPDFKLK